MEQHIKYYDELIVTIKESWLTSFDAKSVPEFLILMNNVSIQKIIDNDPKFLNVLLTLLSNLKEENKKKNIANNNIWN